MAEGSGFGKSILIGDQFVLDGVPAIVSSIPYETVTTVERIDGEGWVLQDDRIEVPGYKDKKRAQQGESIDRILEVMSIDVKKTPLKITVGGTLLAGSGVGASAAICVSLARAVNAEFDLGYSIEEINRVAWQGEFPYHGVASGVDNTASTYGGLLLFWLEDGAQHFERIKSPASFEIVLANSGVTVDTAALDQFIDQQKTGDPGLFAARLETIRSQVQSMKSALEAGDLRDCGGDHVGQSQAPDRHGDVSRDSGPDVRDGLGKGRLGGQGHGRRQGRLYGLVDAGNETPGDDRVGVRRGRTQGHPHDDRWQSTAGTMSGPAIGVGGGLKTR